LNPLKQTPYSVRVRSVGNASLGAPPTIDQSSGWGAGMSIAYAWSRFQTYSLQLQISNQADRTAENYGGGLVETRGVQKPIVGILARKRDPGPEGDASGG
jgi:hypothetical protein